MTVSQGHSPPNGRTVAGCSKLRAHMPTTVLLPSTCSTERKFPHARETANEEHDCYGGRGLGVVRSKTASKVSWILFAKPPPPSNLLPENLFPQILLKFILNRPILRNQRMNQLNKSGNAVTSFSEARKCFWGSSCSFSVSEKLQL